MRFLKDAWFLFVKDLKIEFSAKETLPAMLFFALTVVVLSNFAFDIPFGNQGKVIAGVIWITVAFTAVLGLNKSFQTEQANNCVEGLRLTPIHSLSIYLGKFLGNLFFLCLVELASLLMVAFFYDIDLLALSLPLALLLAINSIGLVAIGTMLAGIAVNSSLPNVLLPLLLYPVILPLLIAGVRGTQLILAGGTLQSIEGWLKISAGCDIIYIVLPLLLFEHVIGR